MYKNIYIRIHKSTYYQGSGLKKALMVINTYSPLKKKERKTPKNCHFEEGKM